jgi:hypothetical protein
MAPAGLVERESADEELLLLIREARLRQRRRLVRQTLGLLIASVCVGLAVLALTGTYSATANLSVSGRPAPSAAGDCPTSPARFVSNSVFSATVLGRGTVRLAIGNVYLKARRRVVLGTTETPAWSAIEVIWLVANRYRGSLLVHGVRLEKPGAIDLQSSDGGLAPGGGTLVLPPSSPNPLGNGQRVYAGAIWVRSAGCYAVTVRGRGVNDRIVVGALPH